MKLVAKLFAVLVLACAAYFAGGEQPASALADCSGNTCEICQCQRRNCISKCNLDIPCKDRCEDAFLGCAGNNYECWRDRNRPPKQPILE